MSGRFEAVIVAIDRANSADPTLEAETREPAALVYGRRMTGELDRICPGASEHLRIAARGQHIERWKLPRSAYPNSREGYHAWRKAQALAHGARVAELMIAAGYSESDGARVAQMLRKEGIKRDPEVQMLEDVICLVFLRWYFADFAATHDQEKIFGIVVKTARKMSAKGRARVAAEFDLPPELAPALAV